MPIWVVGKLGLEHEFALKHVDQVGVLTQKKEKLRGKLHAFLLAATLIQAIDWMRSRGFNPL